MTKVMIKLQMYAINLNLENTKLATGELIFQEGETSKQLNCSMPYLFFQNIKMFTVLLFVIAGNPLIKNYFMFSYSKHDTIFPMSLSSQEKHHNMS